jgi:serine/threonine protein kinase
LAQRREEEAIPMRWACPEAVKTRVYTAKSDVYSFGVVLWEIFSRGQTPFVAYRGTEVMRMVAAGERLTRVESDTPMQVIALIHECTSTQVAARPLMIAVRRALQRLAKALEEGAAAVALDMARAPLISSNPVFRLAWEDKGTMAVGDDSEDVSEL